MSALPESSLPLLALTGVSKRFTVRSGGLGLGRQEIVAVDNVTVAVRCGETVGLVGESGSGKSTLARLAVGLMAPDDGTVDWSGRRVAPAATRKAWQEPGIQMVFQDPYSSFDPTSPVGLSVAEPIKTARMSRQDREDRVADLLELVGLPGRMGARYPNELSGGQLQRAAIARGLAAEPRLLVLDEPVSALDVSTQAQVINLLVRLRSELGLSYLFISHDLALVRHVSHTIVVMHRGRIVEAGDAEEVFTRPRQAYTQRLLSAALDPAGLRQPISSSTKHLEKEH